MHPSRSSHILQVMSSGVIRLIHWRASAFACCFLLCGIAAFGQAARSPEDITREFGSKAYTRCGNSYYSGPFERPILTCWEAKGPVKKCQVFVEASRTGTDPFKFVAGQQPTAAQQMNGIERQGSITFRYSVYRTRAQADDKLFDWDDWADQSNVVTVAQLWEQNGQWFIRDLRDPSLLALGSVMLQQTFGHDITFEQFAKTLRPLACDELTNLKPHTAIVPIAPTIPKKPEFHGTADEFALTFPGLLRQAAIARGLDASTFESEANDIIALVKLCSQITGQMAHSIAPKYGGAGNARLSDLGSQYQKCQGPFIWPSQINPNYKAMDVQITGLVNGSLRFGDPYSWKTPGPLQISVSFSPGPHASRPRDVPTSLIVDATIP